jgi:predicted nucleic acid-binding protein
MALRRELQLLLSVALACEYEGVLLGPEQLAVSGLSAHQAERLILSLLDVAVRVNLDPYLGPRSTDPDDNHVLNLAKTGIADAIVSHNTRHFAVPCHELGVNLFTAGEALLYLRRIHGSDDASRT